MKSFLFLMNRCIVLEGEFARATLGRAGWVKGYRWNTRICLLSAEIGSCRSSWGRQMNNDTHWGFWKRCSNTGHALRLFTYMTDAEEMEGKRGERWSFLQPLGSVKMEPPMPVNKAEPRENRGPWRSAQSRPGAWHGEIWITATFHNACYWMWTCVALAVAALCFPFPALES